MEAEEFITEKYEDNNWSIYPPSRRLVGEWLEEYAQQRVNEVLGKLIKETSDTPKHYSIEYFRLRNKILKLKNNGE